MDRSFIGFVAFFSKPEEVVGKWMEELTFGLSGWEFMILNFLDGSYLIHKIMKGIKPCFYFFSRLPCRSL